MGSAASSVSELFVYSLLFGAGSATNLGSDYQEQSLFLRHNAAEKKLTADFKSLILDAEESENREESGGNSSVRDLTRVRLRMMSLLQLGAAKKTAKEKEKKQEKKNKKKKKKKEKYSERAAEGSCALKEIVRKQKEIQSMDFSKKIMFNLPNENNMPFSHFRKILESRNEDVCTQNVLLFPKTRLTLLLNFLEKNKDTFRGTAYQRRRAMSNFSARVARLEKGNPYDVILGSIKAFYKDLLIQKSVTKGIHFPYPLLEDAKQNGLNIACMELETFIFVCPLRGMATSSAVEALVVAEKALAKEPDPSKSMFPSSMQWLRCDVFVEARYEESKKVGDWSKLGRDGKTEQVRKWIQYWVNYQSHLLSLFQSISDFFKFYISSPPFRGPDVCDAELLLQRLESSGKAAGVDKNISGIVQKGELRSIPLSGPAKLWLNHLPAFQFEVVSSLRKILKERGNALRIDRVECLLQPSELRRYAQRSAYSATEAEIGEYEEQIERIFFKFRNNFDGYDSDAFEGLKKAIHLARLIVADSETNFVWKSPFREKTLFQFKETENVEQLAEKLFMMDEMARKQFHWLDTEASRDVQKAMIHAYLEKDMGNTVKNSVYLLEIKKVNDKWLKCNAFVEYNVDAKRRENKQMQIERVRYWNRFQLLVNSFFWNVRRVLGNSETPDGEICKENELLNKAEDEGDQAQRNLGSPSREARERGALRDESHPSGSGVASKSSSSVASHTKKAPPERRGRKRHRSKVSSQQEKEAKEDRKRVFGDHNYAIPSAYFGSSSNVESKRIIHRRNASGSASSRDDSPPAKMPRAENESAQLPLKNDPFFGIPASPRVDFPFTGEESDSPTIVSNYGSDGFSTQFFSPEPLMSDLGTLIPDD